MPVLGSRIGAVLAEGELAVEELDAARTGTGPAPCCATTTTCSRFAPARSHLPLADLVAAQHYRLAYWRVADEELNYRRFFDVGSLAAIRVEDPEVFDATHRLVVDLVRTGTIDGLRIDHPDGLADPAGLPGPARRGDRRRLGGGREDPRAGRGPSGRLGDGGDHRLRRAVAHPAGLHRPGRLRRRSRRCCTSSPGTPATHCQNSSRRPSAR